MADPIVTPLETGLIKLPVPDSRFTSVIKEPGGSPWTLDGNWRSDPIILRRGGELSFRLNVHSSAGPGNPATGWPVGTFYLTYSGEELGDPNGSGVATDLAAGIPGDFYTIPSYITGSTQILLDRLFSFSALPGRLAYVGYRHSSVTFPGVFDAKASLCAVVS